MRTSTVGPTPERRVDSARGFSLLEVTVTLGLIALAATLVLPRVSDWRAGGLTAAANGLAERLTAARWQALVEGRPVHVPLDSLPPGLLATEEARDGAVAADGKVISFAPLPAALPRTITLTGAAGRTARITIPPGLGSVVVRVEQPS